jgi:hypothetical protein
MGADVFNGINSKATIYYSLNFEVNSNNELTKYNGTADSVSIPINITSIGERAFLYNNTIKKITLNNVTNIGISAFKGCKFLTNIVFLDKLKTIGYDAFRECTSLTNIIFPNSLTSIDKGAFALCSNLTSVVFPASLKSINSFAFYNCINITQITFEGSINNIVVSENNNIFTDLTNVNKTIYVNSKIPWDETSKNKFKKYTNITKIIFKNLVPVPASITFKNRKSYLPAKDEFYSIPEIDMSNLTPNSKITITFTIKNTTNSQSSVLIGNNLFNRIVKVTTKAATSIPYFPDIQIFFSKTNNCGVLRNYYNKDTNVNILQKIHRGTIKFDNKQYEIVVELYNFGIPTSFYIDKNIKTNSYSPKNLCNINMKANGTVILDDVTWYDDLKLNELMYYNGDWGDLMTFSNFSITKT